MLGIGTVFGALGFVIVVLFLVSLIFSPVLPSLDEVRLGLLLYGVLGALMASVICLVGAIPLVLLFRLVFSRLRKGGIGLRRSAMITSGGLAFLGTLVVLVGATTSGMIKLPPVAWPLAVVPSLIAVALSTRLSLDGEF